jgi:hypothetical protein
VAKSSGLGDNFYLSGYDLSTDIGSLSSISGGPALLDVTSIDKSAYERIGGLRNGNLEFMAFFDTAAGKAHPRLSTLPTTDVIATYARGTTLGNDAACMVAKQINYDGTRAADGMFTFAVQAQSNAYGIEWGQQLTAGLRTDTAATNGTGAALDNDGINAVQLPGSSGNTITTPDAASLDIVGDIDIRARIAADDWTPAADSAIVAKYNTTGNQRSYALYLNSTGALSMRWSADGTTVITKNSTVNPTVTDGQILWVRATLDVDNGATGNTVTFYTSNDGTTWTQLGATVVTAATTAIFASTAVLEIGSRNTGTAEFLAGKFFEAQVLSGIGGTSVAHPVASTASVTDATPLTWTVNGTAFFTNNSYFGLQAYLQVTSFTGTDVTIKLQSSMDNAATDAYADVTGGGFTTVTSGPTSERIATSATLPIERYLRVVTTTSGGFTSLTFNVVAVRNKVSTVF